LTKTGIFGSGSVEEAGDRKGKGKRFGDFKELGDIRGFSAIEEIGRGLGDWV
jgi:hypothetical protein